MISTRLLVAAGTVLVLFLPCSQAATSPPPGPRHGPVIQIGDVARFYRLYGATRGQPTAEQLQHDYLDLGSEGLHRLARLRHLDGQSIADNLARHPGMYMDAKRCMAPLPRVRQRLRGVLDTLDRLYPDAKAAPVTIAVGRGKPVGVTDADGVIIGLEALRAVSYFEPDVEDRFVHIIAHEYAHVQQAARAPAFYDNPEPTVLEESLIEGAAEFTGELISGSIGNVDLIARTRGHEKAIESAFVADEDKTDLSDWLYNGTLTQPGDLGYWVGYRIVNAYYQHARDKREALREILEMTDAKAFLARSGWYPGIRLAGVHK
ncbi:MAG TPA: DUF2268 domain-containing putative Zn-dependent protease [Frateuria sp.]|uniref:DUF2268 domain-containing putative Zn-dependent protease n=1 Tax=Frateuria sp. TaxID=2211372 RepID=UPI002D80C460|nr:DUF2268 domain-containing putative Zn-dependent protease [Frateuria sp.]HET6804432.1 DUF2268 domain-containing putative Zn-dependent protease [Frateuria sp.]